jgi:hypothetical protein
LDFGDAPAPYPTLLAANGARHTVAGPRLGNTVLSEANGTPGVPAADDDGVTFTSAITTKTTATTSATVRVNLQNQATAFLDAWVDFSRNGSWNDRGEQIFKSQRLVAGDNDLRFVVPAGAKLGTTYVRFRVSSQGNLLPTGAAATGEVEDYLVTIVAATAPNTVVSPTSTGGGAAAGGEGENAVWQPDVILVGMASSPAAAATTTRSVSPAAFDSVAARDPAADPLLAYLTRARGVNLNADNVDRVWRSVAKAPTVTDSHDWLLPDWDDAEIVELFAAH